MKEITRIHIAKISYDVETNAKKQLDAYLKTLEAYSNDTEIIDDVEIRITEILAERGVSKNGVITEADVTALKEQLGEPREFMTDDDAAMDIENVAKIGDSSRKLYRDRDHAVVGGVLSGIAAFFKINPLWVRLIFVLLAFASFGTMLLVYIVLWIAIPEAASAADKLQMAGRPVTVSSIRELNENEITTSQGDRANGRRIATVLLGLLFVMAAASSAALTIAAIMSAIFTDAGSLFSRAGSDFFLAAFVLAVISGLLFTALMVLGAYASFVQKLTKRVVISGCIIIILGFLSFCAAFVAVRYDSEYRQQAIDTNTKEAILSLPKDVQSAKRLVVDTPGMKVEYVVVKDGELPKSTTSLFSAEGHEPSRVSVEMQGSALMIKAARVNEKIRCSHPWCGDEVQVVTVYGPEVESVMAKGDTQIQYESDEQKELTVGAAKSSEVVLTGRVKNLSITASDDSTVDASSAIVRTVEAEVSPSTQLLLGTIEALAVADQRACPANNREARVSVSNVTNGTITFNGKRQPAKSFDSGCTEITIESEGEK